VLQAIGVAGLIARIFIRLATWMRFVIGALMLVGYQIVLDTSMLPTVLSSVHGGLFGSLSWAALLVLATAVADVWRRGLIRYGICCAVLVAAAVTSALFVPVSKHRVSISFVLLTLALTAIVFLIVDCLAQGRFARAGLLCWWGQNALALYLIHLLILGAVVSPPIDWWYVDAPLWLAVLQLASILTVMSLIARWMFRRR
jgi:fucose 4-O-acetylase-like acetyltransferase